MTTPLDFLILAIGVLAPHATQSPFASFMPMYVGPDQILPLTSVLGAILGVLLMFWNRVLGVFKRIKQLITRR